MVILLLNEDCTVFDMRTYCSLSTSSIGDSLLSPSCNSRLTTSWSSFWEERSLLSSLGK